MVVADWDSFAVVHDFNAPQSGMGQSISSFFGDLSKE
jgi:hypothetical protein